MLLDHLTVAALTLEEGVAHVERQLGVVVPPGGSHPLMGTHNHLMQLGDGVFLEVIALDPATEPKRPRWFALDDAHMRAHLKSSPRLVSWVARVPDLATALRDAPSSAGEAVHVSRGTLTWLISVPQDGSMPFDGAFPTLIEWPAGPHPSTRMADLGCRLIRLEVAHPEADRIRSALVPVFTDDQVVLLEAKEIRLRATIATPNGVRELT